MKFLTPQPATLNAYPADFTLQTSQPIPVGRALTTIIGGSAIRNHLAQLWHSGMPTELTVTFGEQSHFGIHRLIVSGSKKYNFTLFQNTNGDPRDPIEIHKHTDAGRRVRSAMLPLAKEVDSFVLANLPVTGLALMDDFILNGRLRADEIGAFTNVRLSTQSYRLQTTAAFPAIVDQVFVTAAYRGADFKAELPISARQFGRKASEEIKQRIKAATR